VSRLVVISGCSGGGKSTLLGELARRGYPTVEEPGRRIVQEELSGGGSALPWVDAAAFARRAVALALADLAAAGSPERWTFLDRGLVDAAAALQHVTGEPALAAIPELGSYHRRVFLTPPWREIYVTDAERRHEFADALDEYPRLLGAFRGLGYRAIVLPKAAPRERADFVLRTLDSCPADGARPADDARPDGRRVAGLP
jgi:predicted ATPase